MDPAPPVPRKRRWFQMHLSTAVVLMIVAALLLWANTIPPIIMKTEKQVYVHSPGWPIDIRMTSTDPGSTAWEFKGYITKGINAVLCILILTIVAVTCEYPIRRREARKP